MSLTSFNLVVFVLDIVFFESSTNAESNNNQDVSSKDHTKVKCTIVIQA